MDNHDPFDPEMHRLAMQRLQERVNRNQTCEGFEKEKDAQTWLESYLQSTNCFNVYSQAKGTMIFRHHVQADFPSVRCDVLLIPKSRISLGCIVIEIKKSGVKIGPGISQLNDYMRSVFCVGNHAVQVMPSIGFLFPCHKQHSATASWMQQQNLGSIHINEYNGNVHFFSGEEELLRFSPSGELVKTREKKSGKKTGSR